MKHGAGLRNREAEPDAARGFGVGLREALQQFVAVNHGDAGAVVHHDDLGISGRLAQRDLHVRALRRVLDGIVDEIGDGLHEQCLMADHLDRLRRIQLKAPSAFFRQGFKKRLHVRKKCAQLEGLHRVARQPAIGPRDVDQGGKGRHDLVRLLQRRFQRPFLVLRVV